MAVPDLYKGCIAVIDLGGTRIKTGLMCNGNLSDKKIINADNGKGLKSHLSVIVEAINSMLSNQGINKVNKTAMAFPGLVNTKEKKVLSTNKKYDDATELDLAEYFKKNLNADFFIENDARAAAAGEWKFGAGAGSDDMVMVTIGTGIGTAAITEGKLLRGKHFQAGCLGGHFTVNYKGNVCTCGNIGCAEAEAATWNLTAKARKHPSFGESPLSDYEAIDFALLFKTAGNGDIVAEEIKNDCLQIWASAITSYIHAYDPEKVIVGGGVLKSKEEIIPYLQNYIDKYAWTPWGKVKVEAALLGDDAALYGLMHLAEITKSIE